MARTHTRAEDPGAASHASAAAEGDLVLLVFGPASREPIKQPLPANGTLTLGRSVDCDVALTDPSVSRVHAALHVDARGVTLEDMGSANGTRLYGKAQPLHPASSDGTASLHEGRLPARRPTPMAPGAVAQIGSTLLFLERGAELGAAADAGALDALGEPDAAIIADPAMQQVIVVADRVANAAIPVLLFGETGVGKEIVAERLHRRSSRARHPLVRLNCAALSESLIESELFGHDRGAFTGATKSKPGLLESASGGTVFLDEIGELPLSLQAKLLRVLEDNAVLRVGSVEPRAIDVRIVCATNRDLEADVRLGRFRQDLYFRINGITISIPPLRARPGDIVPLARHFLLLANRGTGRAAPDLAPEAQAWLMSQAWPGNVRELRNVVTKAIALCDGSSLTVADLAAHNAPRSSDPMATIPPQPYGDDLRSRIELFERDQVMAALDACGGNQTKAAKMLGIARGTLIARLELYKVPRPRKTGL